MTNLDQLNKQLAPAIQELQIWVGSPEGRKIGELATNVTGQLLAGKGVQYSPKLQKSALAFRALLARHPAFERGEKWTPDGTVAYLNLFNPTKTKSIDFRLQQETTAILVSGLHALSLEGKMPKGSIESLLAIALGADDLSLALRRMIVDKLSGWHPALPPMGGKIGYYIPTKVIECVGLLRTALGTTGTWLGRAVQGNIPVVDVTGITRVTPGSGTGLDEVTLQGQFASVAPVGARAGFTHNKGHMVASAIVTWDAQQIKAIVPPGVGEGPVGLVYFDQAVAEPDTTAAYAFAEAADHCLGPGGRTIVRASFGLINSAIQPAVPAIPLLPGGENLFHGGPLLRVVLTPEVRETDVLMVEGSNLEPGDQLEVDGVLCPTQPPSANQLSCSLLGLPIKGGLRDVRIVRRRGGSVFFPVRVLPTIKRLVPSVVAPGGSIVLEGSGLSPWDLSATLNGETAVVTDVQLQTLQVRAFRPRAQPPAPNPNGEVVELIIFDRGIEIKRYSVTLAVYRIVALGDSIMWGQGLLESQKFSELVAGRILADGKTVYRQDRTANSGASITNPAGSPGDFVCGANPSAFDVAAAGLPQNLTGEKNCGATSIAGQVTQWAAVPADIRARVDLVLLNGGINDLGVTSLLDPFQSEAALTATTLRLFDQMRTVLLALAAPGTSALDVFPNARIVVTGYYPIVSAESDFAAVFAAAAAIGVVGVSSLGGGVTTGVAFQIYRAKLIRMSEVFAATANATLATAVRAAGDPRVKFVMPDWRPENCTFGPNPYVFGLRFPVEPEDPVAAGRRVACNLPCGNSGVPPGAITCPIASLAHPNARGAQAYADAIMRGL